MRLLHFLVEPHDGGDARGVSVWIEEADPERARLNAGTALAAAGWAVRDMDSNETTSAEDYFRPCPSQQAFTRAQADGVAWRFDDE